MTSPKTGAGLKARGRLIPDVMRARELLSLLKAGAVDGLSIGYRTVRGQIDPKSRVRRLYQVDLWEISIVTFPLLNGARVSAVKQAAPKLSRLREAAEAEWRAMLAGEEFSARARAACVALARTRRPQDRAARRGASRGALISPRVRPGVRRDDSEFVLPPHPLQPPGAPPMDFDIHDRTPETKAGIPSSDAQDVYDAMMRTFEEFKSENDGRIKAIEQRKGDVLNEEKLARIDAALNGHQQQLDAISLKDARPALEGRRPDASAREHKSAFDDYVRSGEAAGLRALEMKAMSIASNPDGGYLVPPELETEIGQRLANISTIRGLASVRAISSTVYKKPFMTAGPATGWVGETDPRTQTASAVLDLLSFPAMELYAMPAATATLLEDSAVNLDQWLAGEVDQVFAEQEGQAFVTGDGVNKPKGFLAVTTVANGSWSWGNIGYIASGVAGAFPASNPSDVLVDLIYALRAGYRQNATFVMNRKTQSTVRKFKDSTGNYLWQPPVAVNGKSSLIGFPLADAEEMPDVAANSLSIAFGDFRRGYLIVDRAGVRVLRDPYTAKPYILFYTTKRVGGGVQDFDAIKLLKFAVS